MARAGNCEYYQDCNLQSLPFMDLLKALIIEDANGCFHLNTVVVSGDCSTISQAIACATEESFEELFRKIVVLDDCGLPAVSMFYSAALQ